MAVRIQRRARAAPVPVRGALLRAALALPVLVLCVTGAELGLRALDPLGLADALSARRYRALLLEPDAPPRRYRHRPGASAALLGFSARTDSRGARGPERETPAPARTQRVVVLGDGLTFGWGVDDDRTFAALLEALLRDTGEAFEVVNLGCVGYDAEQALAAFDAVGASYEPDAIVLVPPSSAERPAGAGPRGPGRRVAALAAEPAAGGGPIERHLPYLAALARHARGDRAAPPPGAAGPDPDRERSALLALRARARELGVPLFVLDPDDRADLAELCLAEGLAYGSIALRADEVARGSGAAEAAHRLLARNARARLFEIGLD